MKKYILEILGFTVASLFLLYLLKASLPFYWGNDQLTEKMSYFEVHGNEYDLVYFGPSAVRREFIPSIFEAQLEEEVKAFNLGTAGVYYAEQEYLIRHALEHPAFDSVEYILSYGQEPKRIQDRHYHSLRIKYCFDWDTYITGAKYFYHRDDLTQVYRYTIMFLENFFYIGEVFDMIKWHLTDYTMDNDLVQYQGYVPYEWSVEQGDKKMVERNKFLKKYEGEQYIKGFHKHSNSRRRDGITPYDAVMIDEVIAIQEMAEEKGVTLVTVFEPNMDQWMMGEGVIGLYYGEGKDYKAYFEVDNRWDNKHLNAQGAEQHSLRLAELFNQEFYGGEGIQNSDQQDEVRPSKNKKQRKGKKKRKGKGKKGKEKKRSSKATDQGTREED